MIPWESLQLVYLRQNVFGVKVGCTVVYALEAHNALFVYHEHSPAGCSTLLVPDPVGGRNLTLGVEVRKNRVRNVTERGRVGRLSWPGVVAYTQYLGIFLLEQSVCPAEQGDLVRSTTGE